MSSHHSSRPRSSKAQYGPEPTQPSFRFIMGAMTYVREQLWLAKSHLNTDDMATLKIKCSDLDFDPPPYPPDPNALLRLMPMQTMEQLAKDYDFSSVPGIYSPVDNNFTESDFLGTLLSNYMDCTQCPDAECPDLLLDAFVWKMRGSQSHEAPILDSFQYNLGGIFQVQYMLHVRDASSPHVTYFLAQEAPLKDDQLSVGEVWTMLAVAAVYYCRPGYKNFKYIPVTAISSSGRDFRILQGYADGDKRVINIRKTGIVNLGNDKAPEDEYREQIMTLMRWFLAQPCGKLE